MHYGNIALWLELNVDVSKDYVKGNQSWSLNLAYNQRLFSLNKIFPIVKFSMFDKIGPTK